MTGSARKGALRKQAFDGFVDTSCDRQLYIRLGENDPRWIRRPVEVRQGHSGREEPLAKLGRVYEQRIYSRLLSALKPGCLARLKRPRRREVLPTTLTPDRLRHLHAQLTGGTERLVLLEHAWPMGERFVRQVFDIGPLDDLPTAGNQDPRALRPDLLIVGSAPGDQDLLPRELLSGGQIRPLPPSDLGRRVGIAIVDIKNVHPDRVGRRHFVELLFYAHALAAWLDEVGLSELFFVRVDGHGILGNHDEDAFFRVGVEHLTWTGRRGRPQSDDLLVAPMIWGDVAQLYDQARDKSRALWRAARSGAGVDDISPCIQPACGRCPFIDDCTSSLQGSADGGRGWDVRLIPYLKPAVAAQLRSLGVGTVGQLLDQIDALPLDDVPTPLHAELPSLRMRAEALASGRAQIPEDGHLSLALPRTIHMALVFDLEVDSIHDLVFSFGLYLDVRPPPSEQLQLIHRRFWKACRDYTLQHHATGAAPLAPLRQALDIEALQDRYKGDDFAGWLEGSLSAVGRALVLLSDGEQLHIGMPGEPAPFGEGRTLRRVLVRYQYSCVSGGMEPDHEFQLLSNLVGRAHALLSLCSTVEECVLTVDPVSGHVHRQRLAGFFWSYEQLAHLRELIERHLPEIRADDQLAQWFGALVDWMTPAESDIRHHELHRKMYDLRAFVEGTAGLPQIINYSWHSTLRACRPGAPGAPGPVLDERFWAPHFNYMDFTVWHEALAERDTALRASRERRIRVEMDRKMAGLHEILRHLHREAQEILPRESFTLSNHAFARQPSGFHRLAQLWHRYSKLNAASSALEADQTRTTWPERAVAKLRAGEVEALEIIEDGHEDGGQVYDRFRFRLSGLSSNLKAGEGTYVYLLHRDLRDFGVGYWLRERAAPFRVVAMDWDEAAGGYRVEVVSRGRSWNPAYRSRRAWLAAGRPDDAIYALLHRLGPEGWHVYLSSSDIWSGRLAENKDALLKRQGLGTAWLGQRLMFQLGLEESLARPADRSVSAPEVTLYAPGLLPPQPDQTAVPLRSRVRHRPDDSQRRAIQSALSHPISCIQGPPGTGKSQTIAALIDEVLERADGPVRILVSAFSYPALRVVAQKLLESRGGAGDAPDPAVLTRAARVPLVFARSAGRDPEVFALADGQPAVRDLVFQRGAWCVDGQKISFSGGPRRAKLFERVAWATRPWEGDGSFVLFANAHTLYHLGRPHKNRRFQYLNDDFGFDLIVVDEASQMPADYFAAIAPLVRPFSSTLDLPAYLDEEPEAVGLSDPPAPTSLSRIVLVGDQEQLPPVRQLQPPRKLEPLLDSAFRYFLDVHGVPSVQLAYNYRSHPDIVDCVRQLGLYEALHAHHGDSYLEALPAAVPGDLGPGWLRQLLGRQQVVSALIHDGQYDTALSTLEARLAVTVIRAFYQLMAIGSPERERRFWLEDIGVVSPHNAHGRLIIRQLFAVLRGTSWLGESELMELLVGTIYSVEKFQGSDRRFIIGTVGVSSIDQLSAEEAFLYDMNRFNVLISRAKHKMLLICSRNYLSYVPQDREVMPVAARVREFATELCDQQQTIDIGAPVEMRWRGRR